jgi:hypothetical protein
MASALIQERETVSGNQFRMQRIFEDANQSFLQGTPLMINTADGGLKAWDGVTIANGIAGISKEFGAGLAIVGVPLNTNIAPNAVQNAGGGIDFGSVQNEPSAVNLSRPYFNDGMTGIVLSIPDTVFYGQCGPTQTVATSDRGKQYGMTKDTDGHWYVDKTKTGASAVCVIIGFDQYDTQRGFLFSFLANVSQITA